MRFKIFAAVCVLAVIGMILCAESSYGQRRSYKAVSTTYQGIQNVLLTPGDNIWRYELYFMNVNAADSVSFTAYNVNSAADSFVVKILGTTINSVHHFPFYNGPGANKFRIQTYGVAKVTLIYYH